MPVAVGPAGNHPPIVAQTDGIPTGCAAQRAAMIHRLMPLMCQSGKPQTYRNMRAWVHMALIMVSGFVNLFYGGLVPIISKALGDFNTAGFAAFFQGASWDVILITLLFGIPHLIFAICSLLVSLASLDALKDRILNAKMRHTS